MAAREMVTIRAGDARVTVTARWAGPEILSELCAALDYVVEEPEWRLAVLDLQVLRATNGPISSAVATFVAIMERSARRVLVVLGTIEEDAAADGGGATVDGPLLTLAMNELSKLGGRASIDDPD